MIIKHTAIGVLGAGTWGMALARLLALSGHDVTVWSALPEEIDHLQTIRTQPNLPTMEIPESIRFTKDLAALCHEKELLLFAVPSPFVRATARACKELIPTGQLIVDVAKGIEADSLYTMSQIIEEELQEKKVRVVALSGPTHAEEVACDLPTTIVAAAKDDAAAKRVQDIFMTPRFRVYTNSDILGVELCGAMKNVIALACGICAGLGFGDNTKAALMTRGLAEMTRLGEAMGAASATFAGLAGIGDLIVTATSAHSRNNRCGQLIGQGMSPADAVNEVGMVVEGLNALPAAMALSEKVGVELPITEALSSIIHQDVSPREAMEALMTRERKAE